MLILRQGRLSTLLGRGLRGKRTLGVWVDSVSRRVRLSTRSAKPHAEFQRHIGPDNVGRCPFAQSNAKRRALDDQLTSYPWPYRPRLSRQTGPRPAAQSPWQ